MTKLKAGVAIALMAFCMVSTSEATESSFPRSRLLVAGGSTSVAGATGPADSQPLSPLRPEERNGDYLKTIDIKALTQQSNTSYNSAIFDKSITSELQDRYRNYNQQFEQRAPYQLNGYYEYLSNQNGNKELADWTVRRLLQYHLDHTLKQNLEKTAKETARRPPSKSNGSDQAAAQAVVTISEFHKAIKGTAMNWGKHTKTKFRYDLPSRKFNFGLTSPIADATVDYSTRLGQKQIGSIEEPERLSMALSRKFDFAKASTSVRYGLMSETVNYGINKELIGPLSAQVDRANYLREHSKDETLFRLSFGTSF
ncbi:MAG: hypothetical protein AB1540_13065 [Bdellovibrionota bacterium]